MCQGKNLRGREGGQKGCHWSRSPGEAPTGPWRLAMVDQMCFPQDRGYTGAEAWPGRTPPPDGGPGPRVGTTGAMTGEKGRVWSYALAGKVEEVLGSDY